MLRRYFSANTEFNLIFDQTLSYNDDFLQIVILIFRV